MYLKYIDSKEITGVLNSRLGPFIPYPVILRGRFLKAHRCV
jgi:hypothetical protein